MIGTVRQNWEYTLLVFPAPVALGLTGNGSASALRRQGSRIEVLWLNRGLYVWYARPLAAVATGWMLGLARRPERVLRVPAALLSLYLRQGAVLMGMGFLIAAVVLDVVTRLGPEILAVLRLEFGTQDSEVGVSGMRCEPMRKNISRVVAATLVVGLLAAGCGGKRDNSPAGASASTGTSCEASGGRITIATGPAGGAYYQIGGGIAQLVNDNTKLKVTAAETTGASGQNIQQLMARDYDLALAGADVAADAVNGEGIFDGNPQRLQSLTRLHMDYLHVIGRADADLNSIADLRGKRVSIGPPKSATEIIAKRLLQAAALDPEKDIQAQRLDVVKFTEALKGGTIDAFFWWGGLPNPRIAEITTSLGGKVKFIDVTPWLEKVMKMNPAYEPAVIPATIYKQPAGILTIRVPVILLAREDLPDGSACAITKLIFEKKPALEKLHPAAKEIALDQARQTGLVPLHPGARQALDALGSG